MRKCHDVWAFSLNCLYFKSPEGKGPGYLHPIKKNPDSFHSIHIDHGPWLKAVKVILIFS